MLHFAVFRLRVTLSERRGVPRQCVIFPETMARKPSIPSTPRRDGEREDLYSTSSFQQEEKQNVGDVPRMIVQRTTSSYISGKRNTVAIDMVRICILRYGPGC